MPDKLIDILKLALMEPDDEAFILVRDALMIWISNPEGIDELKSRVEQLEKQ